ncbi:MAG: NAD(P)/FAD-dependent oxidoreductase [Thermodesulfobacteriota bacterium]
MNPSSYDVIVIGAGFGGPVAARLCARAGLSVLLLERGAEVGDKIISGLTIPFYGFVFGPDFIRDGNPPVERPVDGIINYIITDIEKGEMEIEDSLRIPAPFSPVLAFGYNAYCKDFCQWLARKAVEAGVTLRTGFAVSELLPEKGRIAGVVSDEGERIRAKIVINAEGSQGLLAVKAGVRKKYPPDTISLADVYDYEMDKEDVDRIFGHSLRFCWGWDEQKVAPPLGRGNGLMVWPYRESLHFMQDQCIGREDGPVFNLKKALALYHKNITGKLPWWRDEVAPRAKLRARMWDGFEIFVGLNEELRNMPNYAAGMLLIGDAAGLENTELCDGVPTAWFSAEIAARVAIEAVKNNDVSAGFLKRYSDRVRAHPIIHWSVRAKNRYNLRFAQEKHELKDLRRAVHQGWGLGAFGHTSSALCETALPAIGQDPAILGRWVRMYLRYYYNWHHQRFDYEGKAPKAALFRPASSRLLEKGLQAMDLWLKATGPVLSAAARALIPLAGRADGFMQRVLPKAEPVYLGWVRATEPAARMLGALFVRALVNMDPAALDASPGERSGA